MFLIDRNKNEAISLEKKTFKELKFQERKHLQEWICKNTNILGEKLLIIQKEFSGFDDTKERLDLLAIDENGNLVVIENKLDDSGKDVVWQSLKYVSYCSGLTKSDIKDIYQEYLNNLSIEDKADKILAEFLGYEDFSEAEINNDDQRIILIAANFRKEVTSTVMWLIDHNIGIKCIKVTPYKLDDKVLLDTEQIIPVKDAEDYLIKIANKKQEELIIREKNQNRNAVRIKFWTKLLEELSKRTDLFNNVSPSKDNWIHCGSGYSGIQYTFTITGSYARVDLWINSGEQKENKELFDKIYEHKEEIEKSFGNKLDWQKLKEGKGSRIAYTLLDVNVFNESDWPKMIEFMITNMIKLNASLKEILNIIIKK